MYKKINRTNLARSIFIALMLVIFSQALLWATSRADWSIEQVSECSTEGACWSYISVWWNRFIYGNYPSDMLWRPQLVVSYMLLSSAIAVGLRQYLTYKSAIAVALILWIISIVFLYGGVFGLEKVHFSVWSGSLLTLVIAFTAMTMSMLIGIPLAFARLSTIPTIRIIAQLYIEFWRAVPLVMVLFVAVSLIPLFLPYGVEPERLVSVLIAFSLYYSAYMAESIRSGLQTIPKGQAEAATALGITKWRTRDLVLIPQAITLSLPSIVNLLIAILKDTTLVLIIGMFDLLGLVQQSLHDPMWGKFSLEGYIFVAAIMWGLCFSLSRVSVLYEHKN